MTTKPSSTSRDTNTRVSFWTKLQTVLPMIQNSAFWKGILYALSGLLIIFGFAWTFQNDCDTALGITALVVGGLQFLILSLFSLSSNLNS